jgi:Putative zinc-finger
MSSPLSDPIASGDGSVDHLGEGVLAAYAANRLDEVAAWSLEAHLTACSECRLALTAFVGRDRLARNRSVLLAAAAVGEPGRTRRVLARTGVPDHLLALLAATPSLRRSWLVSVVGVLGVVTCESVLVGHLWSGGSGQTWAVFVPFLLVGPLLVLGGVALAFLPPFDPAHQVAAAAPFSGLSLLLVRTVSALIAALVPVAAAALIVPGPGWLPAALLLPCLAVCCVALAAVTVVGPAVAAVVSAACWVLPVVLVTASHSAATVIEWHGQAVWAVVLVSAAVVAFVRRDRFEMGWMR